jgi:hypothetical protein
LTSCRHDPLLPRLTSSRCGDPAALCLSSVRHHCFYGTGQSTRAISRTFPSKRSRMASAAPSGLAQLPLNPHPRWLCSSHICCLLFPQHARCPPWGVHIGRSSPCNGLPGTIAPLCPREVSLTNPAVRRGLSQQQHHTGHLLSLFPARESPSSHKNGGGCRDSVPSWQCGLGTRRGLAGGGLPPKPWPVSSSASLWAQP